MGGQRNSTLLVFDPAKAAALGHGTRHLWGMGRLSCASGCLLFLTERVILEWSMFDSPGEKGWRLARADPSLSPMPTWVLGAAKRDTGSTETWSSAQSSSSEETAEAGAGPQGARSMKPQASEGNS